MKKSSGHADLPEMFRNQMNVYAMAAAAAGVGFLALAEPANAQVVYHSTYKLIPINTVVPLDLNGDGRADITFSNTAKSGFGYRADQLDVTPSAGNKILRVRHASSALLAGVNVGPGTSFSGKGRLMAFADVAYDTTPVCLGEWKDAQGRYLGLEFAFDGKAHFGWVRLSVICRGSVIDAAITGYAYETVAGKSILTGQTQDGQEQDGPEQDGPEEGQDDSQAATIPPKTSLGALAYGWKPDRSIP